jgi:hypothetical protein
MEALREGVEREGVEREGVEDRCRKTVKKYANVKQVNRHRLGKRVCCLLVLNLVSSTPPCQPKKKM